LDHIFFHKNKRKTWIWSFWVRSRYSLL